MGLQFCAIAVIKLLCPHGRKLLMPLSLFPTVTNLKAWKRSLRFLVPDIVEKGLVKFLLLFNSDLDLYGDSMS